MPICYWFVFHNHGRWNLLWNLLLLLLLLHPKCPSNSFETSIHVVCQHTHTNTKLKARKEQNKERVAFVHCHVCKKIGCFFTDWKIYPHNSMVQKLLVLKTKYFNAGSDLRDNSQCLKEQSCSLIFWVLRNWDLYLGCCNHMPK